MLDAAGRMQALIQDLLEYSRIATGAVGTAPVALGPLLDGVVSDLEASIEAAGGAVHVGPMPSIVVSPVQMRQLFQNLIANALKFHRPGVAPIVRVIARPSAAARETWEFEVSDNGIGFEDRHADRIFAPFQRLHGRAAYDGTGIGLAICRRIAERHGGTIAARSTTGSGATFTVTLPGVPSLRDATRP
jgi:signal transduction histidine kinase